MAKKGFLSVIHDQHCPAPPVPNVDLQGKTVVVVGANTGLGFEATKHLARMRPNRLILACRSKEKGEAAVQKIQQETSFGKAEVWLIDLANFSSVKEFASRATDELDRLDILLLNAATLPNGKYSTTQEGWETTLQVNDLSLSLLALRSLPLMLNTAKRFSTMPRIAVISSDLHFRATLEDKVFDPNSNAFQVLSSEEYCSPKIIKTRYHDSKLLNVFFTRALNHRLGNRPLIVNATNPGFCYSELRRDMAGFANSVYEKLMARTTEEGSRQLVWASVGVPEGGLNALRGAYINLSRIEEPSDFVIGTKGREREDKLWSDLISVLENVDPRIKEIMMEHLH